mmetsp:Transcript_8866/g.54571  ORF Transcript_8866/g.54571 Transcript_8866/m.54571 type:complete len:158 (-) Transcript_8866:1648-2121(-)
MDVWKTAPEWPLDGTGMDRAPSRNEGKDKCGMAAHALLSKDVVERASAQRKRGKAFAQCAPMGSVKQRFAHTEDPRLQPQLLQLKKDMERIRSAQTSRCHALIPFSAWMRADCNQQRIRCITIHNHTDVIRCKPRSEGKQSNKKDDLIPRHKSKQNR